MPLITIKLDTAEFNLNVLSVLNRQLKTKFVKDNFSLCVL